MGRKNAPRFTEKKYRYFHEMKGRRKETWDLFQNIQKYVIEILKQMMTEK